MASPYGSAIPPAGCNVVHVQPTSSFPQIPRTGSTTSKFPASVPGCRLDPAWPISNGQRTPRIQAGDFRRSTPRPARFCARLEQALEGEAGSAHGYVLGLPATAGGNFELLKSAVRGLKGRTLTVENDFETSGHSLGAPDRKLGIFSPIRFGFAAPESVQKFLELSVALTLESLRLAESTGHG